MKAAVTPSIGSPAAAIRRMMPGPASKSSTRRPTTTAVAGPARSGFGTGVPVPNVMTTAESEVGNAGPPGKTRCPCNGTDKNKARSNARMTIEFLESSAIACPSARLPVYPFTRLPAGSGIPHAKLVECWSWTSIPLRHRPVPHVLQVVDAHLARPESGRGEVAEVVEESDAILHFGAGTPRIGDVIEHRFALRVVAVDELPGKSPGAFVIQPGQPGPHPCAHVLARLHEHVHELRNLCVG